MWIVTVFDLPVKTAANRQNYRQLRKKLLASGFVSVQKSLLWRWVENKENADALIGKLLKNNTNSGQIAFFCIPDIAFSHTKLLEQGSIVSPPIPPPPWTILT